MICKSKEPLSGAGVLLSDEAGNTKETTTSLDGKFSFELMGDAQDLSFNISKNEFHEKSENAQIENIDESDWKTDVLNNATICLEKIEIIKEEKKLVIKAENVVTLYFDFDKSNLKPREKEILDSVYNVLQENRIATIQISGYTDGLGSDEYNKKLSDRRAKACADYLKTKGIDSERISFVSFGECCPVEMEIINGRDNPDGRSKNRRALINISKD